MPVLLSIRMISTRVAYFVTEPARHELYDRFPAVTQLIGLINVESRSNFQFITEEAGHLLFLLVIR